MRRGSSQTGQSRVRASWLASSLLAFLVGLATPTFAAPGRVACRTVAGAAAASGPGIQRGPCETPDAVDYFASGAAGQGIVVTNFGILLPGTRASSWQVVCDDNFGIAPPPQIQLHPDGRVFAASMLGLYSSAEDGCTWSVATGDIDRKIVFDVAFDRQNGQVFALGEVPRELWRSTDGNTFSRLHTFEPGQTFHRLAVAPSDGRRIYLVGRGRASSTPFARSADGGQSFEFGDLASGISPPPTNALDFVAVAPSDALTLYFYVINATDGDEIWRTTDGGVSVSKILQLQGGEAYSGLAFGAEGRIYVAGTDPFPLGDKPPAHLYVSQDGGKTWGAPIPSGTRGPRYRCLTWAAGKLYACGAGAPGEDEFLIGASSDEGQTWTPTVKMSQLTGAKSCVQARCLQTEEWLCDNYCLCAAGMQPSGGSCSDPGPTDAGVTVRDTASSDGGGRDAATGDACLGSACLENQGCSCDLGGRRPAPGGTGWLLVVGVWLVLAARARHDRD
jgi:photosystem II stability/assembly factor-like uncharacterized protein